MNKLKFAELLRKNDFYLGGQTSTGLDTMAKTITDNPNLFWIRVSYNHRISTIEEMVNRTPEEFKIVQFQTEEKALEDTFNYLKGLLNLEGNFDGNVPSDYVMD
jgi:hypothetical protein